MTIARIAVLAVMISPCAPVHTACPGTVASKNWMADPAVREIRGIYTGVRHLMEGKGLVKKEKNFEYCEPYQDSVRILSTDRAGKARNYYVDAGSDDSMVRRDFYYDEYGRLRFALITGGAVNGTKIEHRIYFSVEGKRIWEIQKLVEGPGYTFPHDTWPDEDIVYDPIKAFNSPNICKETAKSR